VLKVMKKVCSENAWRNCKVAAFSQTEASDESREDSQHCSKSRLPRVSPVASMKGVNIIFL
jgi:hypothetical protein